MRCLAVLTVRNEGAFLLEWLAHHRAVGLDRFVVFSNDCDDGTDDMLDHLEGLGWLRHVRNDGPYDQGGIQFTALKAAETDEDFGRIVGAAHIPIMYRDLDEAAEEMTRSYENNKKIIEGAGLEPK